MPRQFVRAALVLAGMLAFAGPGFGDDESPTIPRGLGSGARLGQPVPGQPGQLSMEQPISPLRRGIGQIVSGWTRDGIQGQELASRIHQLHGKSFDDRRDRGEDRREERKTDRDRTRREDRRQDRGETDRNRREDRR